jgi:integrase
LAAILGRLIKSADGDTDSAVSRHEVAPLVIERDPITGRVTRVETHPHDTPQALDLIGEILRAEGMATPKTSQVAGPPAPNVSAAEAPEATPQDKPRARLVDRIDDFLAHLKHADKHSENTLDYTWEPSLRIFRELVSETRIPFGPRAGILDIHLDLITPDHIDRFLKDFWCYPARQGTRSGAKDARAELALGAAPQSRANALKRLHHIRALLQWLLTRQEIDSAAVGRVEAAMTGMSSARPPQSAQPLDIEGEDEDEDGYVAFSEDDLTRLFHPEVYAAFAAGNAARYWIPVLGRYTGCRLNELAQLCVRDIRYLETVQCLCVTFKELDANGKNVPANKSKKRVKTLAGRRSLPLHPELIRLGFLEFVEERRAADKKFLFDLPWFKKDSFGKYPGRDFRSLSRAVGVWEKRRKVFHSFRATINQDLEATSLEDTLIDRFLGHSVKTVRQRHYGRNRVGRTMPLNPVLAALSKVPADLQIPTWNEVKNAPRQQLKGIAQRLGFDTPAKQQSTWD